MRYLTVQTAAEMGCVNEFTLRGWLRDGRIGGAVKIGKLWRLPEDWMERMDEGRCEECSDGCSKS